MSLETMNRGPPPAGGDENKGAELLAVMWPFTILSIAIVSLKLYTRFRILREPGYDDLITAASVVLAIISTSILTVAVHAGLGRHAYYLDPHQRMQAIKFNLIGNPFGIMAYSLPNISVAMFLNKILNLHNGQKWFIYAVAIIQNIFAGVSSVLVFAQCKPWSFIWDHSIKATCLPRETLPAYTYFVGAYSAFTDVFLGVVPIVALWRLQLKLKTKIGVCLLMSATLFAAICSIVKTTQLDKLQDMEDFTYASVDLLYWAVIESNVIIIASCVPSLRPFIVSTANRSSKYVHDGKPNARRGALGHKHNQSGIETIGSKRINHISLDSLDEVALPQENGMEKKTEFITEWEDV